MVDLRQVLRRIQLKAAVVSPQEAPRRSETQRECWAWLDLRKGEHHVDLSCDQKFPQKNGSLLLLTQTHVLSLMAGIVFV